MQQIWHLAQMNIGRMIGATIDDPIMKEFVDQLDEINAIAESSKGFVWRLKDENNNATSIKVYDDPQIIVNLSVWETVEDLETFVYNGKHLEALRRRKEWFSKMKLYGVMWYVPAGKIPTVQEGKKRFEHLEANGATAFAFDFKKRFAPPQNLITQAGESSSA